jgi:hypothetical protein
MRNSAPFTNSLLINNSLTWKFLMIAVAMLLLRYAVLPLIYRIDFLTHTSIVGA